MTLLGGSKNNDTNSNSNNISKCFRQKEKALTQWRTFREDLRHLSARSFLPSCDADGSFSARQCHILRQTYCWCALTDGEEVRGTFTWGISYEAHSSYINCYAFRTTGHCLILIQTDLFSRVLCNSTPCHVGPSVVWLVGLSVPFLGSGPKADVL